MLFNDVGIKRNESIYQVKTALSAAINPQVEQTKTLLLLHLGFVLAAFHCSQTVALLRAQIPRTALAFQLHKCVCMWE